VTLSPESTNSESRNFREGKGRYSVDIRLRVVTPVVRFRLSQVAGEKPLLLTPMGAELRTLKEIFAYQSRVSGISERTIRRWCARFLRFGFPGLSSRRRSDRGISRWLENRGLAVIFLADRKAAGNSAALAYRALLEIWPRLYPDERPPCYRSVKKFLESQS